MAGESFIIERLDTPLGEAMLIADGDGALRWFEWDDPAHRWEKAYRRRYPGVALVEKKNPFGHAKALRDYFDGDIFAVDRLDVAFAGTPFQLKVWNALRAIRGGETTTYAALAGRIGNPAAVRAVGLANGQNPISLVVPCHRVIGSNGTLTGYGGGLPRKSWLLDHEARHAGNGLSQRKAKP
jgi:methylated-DNA-[protein]-cysteine S-methyltransferase